MLYLRVRGFPMNNYIKNNLNKNEQLCNSVQLHTMHIYASFVWVIIGFGLLILFSVIGIETKKYMLFTFQGILWFLLTATPGIHAILTHFTTELAYTDKRLIGKTGIISTKTLDAPLNKIQNVSVDSSIIGRILGYGTVEIHTASGKFSFSAISEPHIFKKNLMLQIDEYNQQQLLKQTQLFATTMNQSATNTSRRICTACGKTNDNTSAFCNQCGNRL